MCAHNINGVPPAESLTFVNTAENQHGGVSSAALGNNHVSYENHNQSQSINPGSTPQGLGGNTQGAGNTNSRPLIGSHGVGNWTSVGGLNGGLNSEINDVGVENMSNVPGHTPLYSHTTHDNPTNPPTLNENIGDSGSAQHQQHQAQLQSQDYGDASESASYMAPSADEAMGQHSQWNSMQMTTHSNDGAHPALSNIPIGASTGYQLSQMSQSRGYPDHPGASPSTQGSHNPGQDGHMSYQNHLHMAQQTQPSNNGQQISSATPPNVHPRTQMSSVQQQMVHQQHMSDGNQPMNTQQQTQTNSVQSVHSQQQVNSGAPQPGHSQQQMNSGAPQSVHSQQQMNSGAPQSGHGQQQMNQQQPVGQSHPQVNNAMNTPHNVSQMHHHQQQGIDIYSHDSVSGPIRGVVRNSPMGPDQRRVVPRSAPYMAPPNAMRTPETRTNNNEGYINNNDPEHNPHHQPQHLPHKGGVGYDPMGFYTGSTVVQSSPPQPVKSLPEHTPQTQNPPQSTRSGVPQGRAKPKSKGRAGTKRSENIDDRNDDLSMDDFSDDDTVIRFDKNEKVRRRGESNRSGCRGVYFDVLRNLWRANWPEETILLDRNSGRPIEIRRCTRTKGFSAKKFGYEDSKKMAVHHRHLMVTSGNGRKILFYDEVEQGSAIPPKRRRHLHCNDCRSAPCQCPLPPSVFSPRICAIVINHFSSGGSSNSPLMTSGLADLTPETQGHILALAQSSIALISQNLSGTFSQDAYKRESISRQMVRVQYGINTPVQTIHCSSLRFDGPHAVIIHGPVPDFIARMLNQWGYPCPGDGYKVIIDGPASTAQLRNINENPATSVTDVALRQDLTAGEACHLASSTRVISNGMSIPPDAKRQREIDHMLMNEGADDIPVSRMAELTERNHHVSQIDLKGEM